MHAVKKIQLSLIVVTLLALAASPALADPPKLEGAWEVAVTFDVGGGEDILASYHRGGTLVLTGPSNLSGDAHGVWERTGPRTYATRSVIFAYGPDGNLAAKVHASSEIEVSLDGNSYTGAFRGEVRALDGTLIEVNTGTETGTRITLD